MILKWFLRHQWLEMVRASIWQKNIIVNVFIGLILLIVLLELFLLGFFIDEILREGFPDRDPISLFNGVILYYVGFEFFMRFILQNLPTLNIETYLHLPIKKSGIVHYVSAKSIAAIGNYLPWLVLFPFAFKVIQPAHGLLPSLIWLMGAVSIIFTSNFTATYIKRQMVGNVRILGLFFLFFAGIAALDILGSISLSSFSSRFFGLLITDPLFLLFFISLTCAAYFLNYFFLKSRLYPEEIKVTKTEKTDRLANLKYLKNLGVVGQLISLDLRLIWRHKRTRSVIYLAPIFILYGLFFYPQKVYLEMPAFLIFVGIFMTGGLMLNYANYCFSYESNYFDNILSNYKNYERYLLSKYIIAVSIASVCYVLTTPYVFFGFDVLLINTMAYLYNIGFLTFILFYAATFSKKRMDLSRGAAFNYQGIGATHWLALLPAFLLPVFIYLPFQFLGQKYLGLFFIGTLGVLGLVFRRNLMQIILRQFLKKKYDMAEGFRQ